MELNIKNIMAQLFMRLGIVIEAEDSDINELYSAEDNGAVILRLIKEGKAKIDGDSYLPSSTDLELGELDVYFNINPTIKV